MAILISSGAHGGIFDRWGLVGGILGDVNSFRGGTATTNVGSGANIVTRYNNMETYWAANTNIQSLVDQGYASVTGFQGAQNSLLTYLQGLATNTIITMANADTALATKTLFNAMNLLVTQMNSNSNSVQSSTVAAGSQTAVGTPNGTPIVVVSVKDCNGLALQYAFAETLTFTCTQDSQGGATLSQEPMSIIGQNSVTDTLSYLWPAGSNVNVTNNLIDASQNNSGGNMTWNGDFETFVNNAHVPDNWASLVGTPGSVGGCEKGSGGYTGSFSLEFLGDGATATAVTQQFNSVGGTPATLKALSQYAVNFWVKGSATMGNGVLKVDLYDGSSVINDAQGTANTITQNLAAINTSWTNVNGFFRTPALLTTNQYIRIRLSTAIDSGKNLFIDRFGFALTGTAGANGAGSPGTNPGIYPGGPQIAIFSGATKVLQGDQWTVAITNSYGGFQKLLERLFGMRLLNLVIPNAGSPSISDSLIA